MMNKYLIILCVVAYSMFASAQSTTNSPYSQFGLGKIADRSVGAARGMNGTGIAFREGNQVNSLNPASYSSIDSLTFIFDIGMSLQTTHFKETDGKSINARNAAFEYAIASFRVVKHLGVTAGILPFTNIGYDYSCPTQTVPDFQQKPTLASMQYTEHFAGEGGLHEVFIGAGWEPFKGFSAGFNVGYLWGDINNNYAMTFSDAQANSLAKVFLASVHSYKLDFGLQYSHKILAKDVATIGLTFSPRHSLSTDSECLLVSADTTIARAKDALYIPTQWGVGLAWKHADRWKVGIDYTLQKWGSIDKQPYISDKTGGVVARTSGFYDRHAINAGGEYCKDVSSKNFTDRLRYRLGVGYSSAYQDVNGVKGPREISVSAGIGIPIINGYNHRSIVNVGLKWQNFKGNNMLTENTLLLNIGVMFNERWFDKWKFE